MVMFNPNPNPSSHSALKPKKTTRKGTYHKVHTRLASKDTDMEDLEYGDGVSEAMEGLGAAGVGSESAIMVSPRKTKPAFVSPHKNVLSSILLSGTKKRSSGKRKRLRKGNCHHHHKQHIITLKCNNCGLGFCAKALQKSFSSLQDTKTGCWACPRCTGVCGCNMCKAKKSSRAQLEVRVKELMDLRNQYSHELEVERSEFNVYVTYVQSEVAKMEEAYSALEVHYSLLQKEVAEVTKKRESGDMSRLWKACEDQKRVILELQKRLESAQNQIVDGERMRKQLNNTILELKGNIRVFVRVRPFDYAWGAQPPFSYPRGVALGDRIVLHHAGLDYPFTFDKVFAGDSSQEDVFTEISELVQSSIDGFKVSIFAYGQTGSGKTFTMFGGPKDPQKGLIPRSLELVFQKIQALQAHGFTYKLQASMLEIYKEKIFDLLKERRECNIRSGLAGKPSMTDAEVVDVSSIRELSELLQTASKKRSTARTQMNEVSSRSHFLVALRIHGVDQREAVEGILTFIDLAGSDKFSTGRPEETNAINRSLTSLGQVISELANKATHTSYRNSKLTFLLQPCLEGDGKTLLFVNLSGNPESTAESLSSLRYAANAKLCELGIARRRVIAK